ADIVGAELTAARNRIAQGRTEIKQHVASLPKNLQKIGQEAAAAIGSKFDQLDSDVDSKRDALVESLAQKYVTARDAANARAQEMRDANNGLWAKAKDAVNGVIETIKNLKSMLLGVLAKAVGVIDTIIEDPIKFLGNLVSAIKMGLNQFVANIVQHLKKGLMGWLFGTLAEAGITLPESFDLKGILGLVLQILGLTYANIRARAVKVVGEKTVAAIEKTVEIFTVLVKEGPAGLWKFIQDKLASLKETMMDAIKDFVITKVITAGITWLISMLNPASAFIKACKMIYDVVMFFVERGSQIMGLVNAVIDGVSAIASGALGGAANLVEQALGKAIPVAIGFLASLLGLGGIAEKIKGVIEKIQKPINSMIDKLIGGALKIAKKVGGAIKGLVGKGKDWAKKKLGKDEKGPDDRTPSQKQEAEEAAAQEAGALLDAEGTTPEGVRKKLPSIKDRHKLDSISLVDEGNESYHVTTVISRALSKSQRLAAKPNITLTRPEKFRVGTLRSLRDEYRELHEEDDGGRPRLTAGQGRRHIVSSQEVLDNIESRINSCQTIAQAKALLESHGESVSDAPSNAELQRVSQARLKRFFDDVENLMVGDQSANSSIGAGRDKPANWSPSEMATHVRKMKNRYFLS
ncbi:MAG: hypothetical protein IT340_02965, partial [Chloroflexi bacterium]|nr:hypothetical protein [Chloroflexota bacterium]